MSDATPGPQDVEKVLEEFEARKDKLEAFCAKTKGLIEEALQDAGVRYQSVQSRVKSKKKLREKYLDEGKNYKRLDDITDLAGLRVITYYEDEVDSVAEVIKREFEIDPVRSVDRRMTEPDRFGYQALNYVCCHLKKRLEDVEYKKYAGVWCEIQITSILPHAWSEIEHEWYDLRKAYPDKIKRRFSRLMALFEIAESEFIALKKERSSYQKAMDIQVAVELPDVPLDVVSMRSLISQDAVVAELDGAVSERLGIVVSTVAPVDQWVEMISNAAKLAGLCTVNQVRAYLKKHREALLEYVDCIQADSSTRIRLQPGAAAGRGVSVIQLSYMLLGGLGGDRTRDAMVKVYGERGFAAGAEAVMGRAAIGRKVLAKYGLRRGSHQ